MEKQHKDAVWVPHAEIEPEVCGKGVKRRILAYSKDAMCVENTFETGGVGAMHCHPHTQVTYIVSGRYRFTIGDETREVGPGDTLLKQDGVMHGCVCLEGGVMLDFFTPHARGLCITPAPAGEDHKRRRNYYEDCTHQREQSGRQEWHH